MHHPWRAFRDLVEWTLHWRPMPEGILGVTDFTARTVTLDTRLTQAERRCTIAHETQHINRGPVPASAVYRSREERYVDQAAARQLIDIRALGEAIAWSESHAEAAEELWVDEATLRARLAHLHPSEKAYLKRRLAEVEDLGGNIETC